jgi:Na+-transporting NADH:ubiquinone oxidoreductase subunit NqrB
VFAGVAAFSLLTKYVIRSRGTHVFNPSNIGLVVVFVAFGSTRVEPLDFWWAPLNSWMIAAYVVILVGGLLITRRLRLLAAAASFWIALAVGVGVLAVSGHCMTARWAFAPVCGFDYWRVVVTSPEVLVFLFFMITDPKTVPAGRVGRVVFGLLVAVASTLLMAPQSDEFGTKVALLGGLVVVCAFRPLVDRLVPEPGSAADGLGRFAIRVVTGDDRVGALRAVRRLGLIAAAVGLVGVGVVAAGSPARGVVVPGADDVLGRVPHDVDPGTFPTISVEQGVVDWNHEIVGAGARAIVLTLAENLELENQALLRDDAAILTAVDHGDRLDDMQARLERAVATGTTVIERYQIDAVHVTLLVPFGRQDGLSLGLESRGTVTEEIYDAAGDLQDRSASPFDLTFVLRQATGGRWLNVDVLPTDAGG